MLIQNNGLGPFSLFPHLTLCVVKIRHGVEKFQLAPNRHKNTGLLTKNTVPLYEVNRKFRFQVSISSFDFEFRFRV